MRNWNFSVRLTTDNISDDDDHYRKSGNSSSKGDDKDDSISQINLISLTVISCVGIIGNATVVVVFLNHRKLRQKIPNIFIINQSAIDLFCALVLLLPSLTIKDFNNTMSTGWLRDLECGFWNGRVLLWGGLTSSSWNLVCLTVERYIELIYPFWHKAHVKMNYIYISLAACWILGIGSNVAYKIPTSKIVDGKCRIAYSWPNDVTAAAVGIFNLFLPFLLPFIILVFCYGRILWMLSRRINTDISDGKGKFNHSSNEVTGHTDEIGKIKDAQTDKFQIARRNTIKTLLIVGCCFIICWSQNQIVYLMFNFGYDLDWNSDYWVFTNFMVFLNCTINPFIYLFKYTDYQIALKTFFRCKAQD